MLKLLLALAVTAAAADTKFEISYPATANPGPITGDVTSPLFGRANQMAGNLNGEGFSENANNRRLELQCRFTF